MFDPVTTALIASAPALDGVDLVELPQQFTRVFADIVSARIRLRDNPEGNLSAELIATLTQMRKIAAAHEALVTLIPDWSLTPNGNKLSAAIAAASAADGIKTLVFVQSTVLAQSSSKEFRERLETAPIALKEHETKLYNLAVEEMGGPDYCYLTLEDDGTFLGGAICHHALLLREERHLGSPYSK